MSCPSIRAWVWMPGPVSNRISGSLVSVGRSSTTRPAEAGVRAAIAVPLDELAVEDGRPQVGAGGEPALDVGEPGGGQLGRSGPWSISRWRAGIRVSPGRSPVEPELAGEGGDRPAVAVEHVQFHPDVLRLQSVPPVVALDLSSPSLTGGTSRFLTQTKDPRVTPRASAFFVLNSLRYSCPLTVVL